MTNVSAKVSPVITGYAAGTVAVLTSVVSKKFSLSTDVTVSDVFCTV